MARAAGNHIGTFDNAAAGDIIDSDAFQAQPNLLVGSADTIPSPNGFSFSYQNVKGGNFLINSTGVDAIVLGAPIAGIDDNITCSFQDIGGHAHTITSTGNLVTNSASVNTATFSGNKGANVSFRAYNGKWLLISSLGITFS